MTHPNCIVCGNPARKPLYVITPSPKGSRAQVTLTYVCQHKATCVACFTACVQEEAQEQLLKALIR